MLRPLKVDKSVVLSLIPDSNGISFSHACNESERKISLFFVSESELNVTIAIIPPFESVVLSLKNLRHSVRIKSTGSLNLFVQGQFRFFPESAITATIPKEIPRKRVRFSDTLYTVSLGDGLLYTKVKEGNSNISIPKKLNESLLHGIRWKLLINGKEKILRLRELPEGLRLSMLGMRHKEKRKVIVPSEYDSVDGKGEYEIELVGRA
jgi:hypothetical protein